MSKCERHGWQAEVRTSWPYCETEARKSSLATPPCSEDERIAMKMMVRYKDLCRASPMKPGPDIGWMQELLQVVREMDSQNS